MCFFFFRLSENIFSVSKSAPIRSRLSLKYADFSSSTTFFETNF